MHLTNGTSLQGGKYRIDRFISSGGFGNTYEGVHTMMDTRVAIKEFFLKMFCNRDENTSHVTVATQGNRELVEKLRKKFNEEAKSVFQMKHDNIVRVLDIFEENGTAYYVMEYIDGKSLNEITKERGALPEAEAVGYICQVADALKYVHSLNRLHLDIKPGNIMVDKNGKAILIDFGASKHYDDESGENTSTLMGVNTKGYAPIEQSTQSFTSFSPATDIYALGATLYKLLTCVTPPDANMILAEEDNLQPLPNNISGSTRKAVMAAMQLKRKDRPQNIDEFIAMLDKQTDAITKKTININNSKKNGNVLDAKSALLEGDSKFSRDVEDLCALTKKSYAICEKALLQNKGDKQAALTNILTDKLYKKCGNPQLGIDRRTCKRYLESADNSIEKAERRIANLEKERIDKVNKLYIEFGDESIEITESLCLKMLVESDFDVWTANEKLLKLRSELQKGKTAYGNPSSPKGFTNNNNSSFDEDLDILCKFHNLPRDKAEQFYKENKEACNSLISVYKNVLAQTPAEELAEIELKGYFTSSAAVDYSSLKGRIGRTEYFLTQVGVYIGGYLAIIYGTSYLSYGVLAIVAYLYWLQIAQGAKRCHDLGKSGWYQLIPFYFFWLLFAPKKKDLNRYGLRL